MDHPSPTSPGPKLAELVGGLTLACDIANGFPAGKVLRTVVLAMRVGRRVGLDAAGLRDVYYTNLFRFLGCTGFAHEEASEYGAGDDIVLRNVMSMADPTDPVTTLSSIARRVGSSAPIAARAAAVARLLGDGRAVERHARAQCDTAIRLASLVGMSSGVQQALAATCERWDGKGAPHRLEGEAIAMAMRLHHLADVAEIAMHRGGVEAARALVNKRAGKGIDPTLARLFSKDWRGITSGLEGPDLWDLYLAEEPEPHATCGAETTLSVARAFAHVADMKSAFTIGHSTRVATLATGAGRAMGLPQAELVDLERAALLHDMGRLSVPNTIWDRPSKLGFADWERVRLHTYYTERVLSSSAAWRALAPLAACAHEQPSGKGYHRGLGTAGVSRAARILAAADSVAAMREPRAYRAPRAKIEIERELAADVRASKLDKHAVDAVLGGASTPSPPNAATRTLSEREAEVVKLLARGKTNKEIGLVLGISARTVQVHVAHAYDKLGVYSRAGAALYAVESGLFDE